MRLKELGIIVTGMYLLFPINVVQAENSKSEKFYVGFNSGKSKIDFGSGSLIASSLDETDSSVEALFGYRFGNNWGVEAGWLDIGSHGGKGNTEVIDSVTSQRSTVPLEISAKVSGVTLRANKTFYFTNNIYASANLGVYFWEQETKFQYPIVKFTDSKSGQDILYGLSVGYDINDSYGLLLEWEKHSLLEAEVLSLGVRFSW